MADQAELLALHGRLIAGDGRAAHRIVELAIQALIGIVARQVRLRDPQDVEQACVDALLKYLQEPHAYDPNRGQLLTYLAAIAGGKAMTIQRSNVRRLARDAKYLRDQEILGTPDCSLTDLDLDTLDPVHRMELAKEPGDEEILRLIARGENYLPEVAKALNLPNDEEGHVIAGKRLERVRGRLRRLKTKIGG